MNVVFLGVLIGLWGYLFTHELVQQKEVFGFVGRFANKAITGDSFKVPDPDKLCGLSLMIWKWIYCEKCHSGVVAVSFSIAAAITSRPPFDEFLLFADSLTIIIISMFTALLARRIIKGQ